MEKSKKKSKSASQPEPKPSTSKSKQHKKLEISSSLPPIPTPSTSSDLMSPKPTPLISAVSEPTSPTSLISQPRPMAFAPLEITPPDTPPSETTQSLSTISDTTQSDPTQSDPTQSDPTQSDQSKSDQSKSDQSKSDQSKSDQSKSDQSKSDQSKSDQSKTEPSTTTTDPTKSDTLPSSSILSDPTPLTSTKSDPTQSTSSPPEPTPSTTSSSEPTPLSSGLSDPTPTTSGTSDPTPSTSGISSASPPSTTSSTVSTALKNKKRLWLGLRPAATEVNQAKMIFFYGPSFNEHYTYDLEYAKDILSHEQFNPDKKTVLYLHGYVETINDESVHVIVDAYLKRNDHNILILDWETLADGNFFLDAVKNAKELGPKIADVLLDLFEHGLKLPIFHLVGHSLGGQLGGMIARSIIKKTKGKTKLRRLSALDPAFPFFYPPVSVVAVGHKDAELVDVIHTDAWLYGAPLCTGTADFWPNGGTTLQPGCPRRNFRILSDIDLCSHRRSWRFWAESVANKTPTFHAVKATGYRAFKRKIIDESNIVHMGIDCAMTAKGSYFLQTNSQQPYSKGIAGIHYLRDENIVVDII